MNTCSVEFCEKNVAYRRLCSMHYSRMMRHGELGGPEPTRMKLDKNTPCSVPECGRKVESRGYCRTHAEQVRRHGQIVKPVLRKLKTVEGDAQWFESNVDRSGNGCHPWTAAKMAAGYGSMTIRGKHIYAHRYAYELAFGEIPTGSVIDHKCGNPPCVNPEHLQAVTQKQNNENRVVRKDSATGIRGVDANGSATNPYRASLRHKGKAIHVGHFATKEDAEAAVMVARSKYFTNSLVDEGWRDARSRAS